MSTYGDTWNEWYDRIHVRDDDIPFWVEEAKLAGGPVLELACGTGRVAIPLAQAGIPVVGLDSSASLLKIARAKARKLRLGRSSLRFVLGDMRGFSLKQQYPLIIIPFSSFLLLLSVADQLQSLAAIREHLAPSGRLIIDVFVPSLDRLVSDADVRAFSRERIESKTGHRFVLGEQSHYDNFNQIITARNIIEEWSADGELIRTVLKEYQLRYIYRFEMLHLLAATGFDVAEIYGSFDHEPLDETSTEMIWVARPKG